jgi:hypothetical protein
VNSLSISNLQINEGFMRRIVVVLLVAMLGVSTSAFAGKKQERPGWIDNPGMGVSASSITHVKGRHYQEELAIARGRERLAARLGVDVESVHAIHEQVVNDRAYVTSDKEMKLVVSKKSVKARVREKWLDRASDTLWVWVYPVK